MEYKKFMTSLEGYYGKYGNSLIKDLVATYIVKTFKESELDKFFSKIVQKISNKYKLPPDIATLESLAHETDSDKIKIGANKAWEMLCIKSNRYTNIFFEDLRIQESLSGIGGWMRFCDRLKKEEPFMKKQFIDLYITYTKNPPETKHRMLKGDLDLIPLQIVGDKEKCKLLLDQQALPDNSQVTNLIENMMEQIK